MYVRGSATWKYCWSWRKVHQSSITRQAILAEFATDESAKWVGLPTQAVSATNLATGAALAETILLVEPVLNLFLVVIH